MPADSGPRCEACHRPLRRPSPSGFGPVCERRRNARPVAKPVARASPAGPVPLVPGQTEFPLQPMQPSLWSLWPERHTAHTNPTGPDAREATS